MCLLLIARDAHPDYTLVIAANRDEFYARPTAPAQWWDDHPRIFAGRDLEHGGTWLGISDNGRIAALTNYRDPRAMKSGAPTRGALTRNFLLDDAPAHTHLTALAAVSAQYNAFNLLAWDGAALHLYSSRDEYCQEITPEISAVSNQSLDTPWPKVVHGKRALAATLRETGGLQREAIFALLRDRTQPPDAALPDTGVGLQVERELAPIFVARPGYGTRCSTLVTVERSGAIEFEERSYDRAGAVVAVVRERIARS